MKNRCIHTGPFWIDGRAFSASEIIEILGPLLRPERRARIACTITNRTSTIAPVVEGLYDRGNASAVLRSAEALGYQNVHLIELSERYKQANRVTQGADKWLDVEVWQTTEACVSRLHSQGYRILATHLEDARPISEFAFDEPTAIFFGNERDGLTQRMIELADECVVIPMLGFVQSFNISVAAALSLYHIYQDRLRRLGGQGDLTEYEQRCLTASYYLRSIDEPARILLEARRRVK